MGLDAADFHYLTILRELEKEAALLEGRKATSERRQVNRANGAFRDLFLRLTEKPDWANITLALKISSEQLLETELASAKVLRELTEGRPTLARLAAGDWPPVVPAPRMVERFTALTIASHAENPQIALAEHAETAFRHAVLPALAWGLVGHLYEQPEHLRPATQQALARHFRGKPQPHRVELSLEGAGTDEHVPFVYLRLVEAWFKMLASPSPWRVSPENLAAARSELATLLERPLTDLDTHLWSTLGEHYTGQLVGSQRARVVDKASAHSPGSAGFIRERLQLFAAANAPGLSPFRSLTERNLPRANATTFAAEDPKPAQPREAGVEACGAAFWLARACFGRHVGDQTLNPAADKASERVLLLLLRAAALLKDEPALRLTCVRYAAGFATNPRYVRSSLVLDLQKRLVDLYAAHTEHRSSLVELFKGRIAWQYWRAGLLKSPKLALHHYAAALRDHRHERHGFDAEAPVHFFPELIVLLRQSAKRMKREKHTLAAVDFITQRNYGIYFDVERETKMIDAGFEEFTDFKQACVDELFRRKRSEARELSDVAETDWEEQTDYAEMMEATYVGARSFQSLISDLQSSAGMTIKRKR